MFGQVSLSQLGLVPCVPLASIFYHRSWLCQLLPRTCSGSWLFCKLLLGNCIGNWWLLNAWAGTCWANFCLIHFAVSTSPFIAIILVLVATSWQTPFRPCIRRRSTSISLNPLFTYCHPSCRISLRFLLNVLPPFAGSWTFWAWSWWCLSRIINHTSIYKSHVLYDDDTQME